MTSSCEAVSWAVKASCWREYDEERGRIARCSEGTPLNNCRSGGDDLEMRIMISVTLCTVVVYTKLLRGGFRESRQLRPRHLTFPFRPPQKELARCGQKCPGGINRFSGTAPSWKGKALKSGDETWKPPMSEPPTVIGATSAGDTTLAGIRAE